MKYLMLLTVLMIGCTKTSPTVCQAEQPVETTIATTIQNITGCPNLDAIRTSVVAEVTALKLNFCPTLSDTKKGALGDKLCKPLIDDLKKGALAKMPPEWGTCTGGPILDADLAKLITACQNAL